MIETEVMGWAQLVLSFGASFYLVHRIIPLLIKVAYRLDIYDKPDGERKVHTKFISNLGGIAIFIAFLFGFLFSGYSSELMGLPYFIGALIALFFTGLKDDLIGLSPKTKLIIEVFAGAVVIYVLELTINSFGGVFLVNDLPNFISATVTLFTIIVVINAFNLIDGIDGLAGGVASISSLIFSIGFFISGEYLYAVMAFMMVLVCISYLRHNFYPAKIFMGDTGSLVIGFILSILAVKYIGLSEYDIYNQLLGNNSVIVPIAALSIPLYDTLRVFGRRILRGQSPFSADSDHVHHTLLRMGWGQKRTVLYLYSVAVIIPVVAFLTANGNVNISLLSVVISMMILLPTSGYKRKLAASIGLDLTKVFKPRSSTDDYSHLEYENKKKNQSRVEEESIL